MIEYLVWDMKKDKDIFKDLESNLNRMAVGGWRVKIAIWPKLILVRRVPRILQNGSGKNKRNSRKKRT